MTIVIPIPVCDKRTNYTGAIVEISPKSGSFAAFVKIWGRLSAGTTSKTPHISPNLPVGHSLWHFDAPRRFLRHARARFRDRSRQVLAIPETRWTNHFDQGQNANQATLKGRFAKARPRRIVSDDSSANVQYGVLSTTNRGDFDRSAKPRPQTKGLQRQNRSQGESLSPNLHRS
jgi:hypothetical protein